MLVGPNDVKSQVGSSVNHAATIHQGSFPHVILSRRGRTLKFRWERGDFLIRARQRGIRGGFHYFAQVRHPGNKRPVRYLTTPLHMFGRLHGFRVSTVGWGRTRLP